MEGFVQYILPRLTMWQIPFLLLIVTGIAAVCTTVFRGKKKHFFTTSRVLFVGVFLSATAYFLPVYLQQLQPWIAFLTALQHALRLFAFDDGFVEQFVNHTPYPAEMADSYVLLGAALYCIAPMLTFGFILSFVKNLWAHIQYAFHIWGEAHVFSELNEKSLALAKSLAGKYGYFSRNLIVFTDVIDKKDEGADLIDEAEQLGAILFRRDMGAMRFRSKLSGRRVSFYLISENEKEKIRHTESILSQYDYRGVALKVFSNDIRMELLLAARAPENLTLDRVNDIQALIYHNLYTNGSMLFKRARKIGDAHVISVVLVGLGQYGQEMLKALTWYCQMEGYKLKIHAFDADEQAKARFEAMCPELMSPEHNHHFEPGEARYAIDIHPGIDVSVPAFEEEIQKLTDATYCFVCLGEDAINLTVAKKMREIFGRMTFEGDAHKPDIETVIYDSNLRERMEITWQDVCLAEEKKHIAGITNFKKEPYNLLMIGDLDSFYSKETLFESELIRAGLAMHLHYAIAPLKISFTANRMEEEWQAFVQAEKLQAAWQTHLEAWNAKHASTAFEFGFAEAIGAFSFLTSEEEQEKENGDAEKKRSILNEATARKEAWEKCVYAKFKACADESTDFVRTWEKRRDEEIKKAKKDFRFEYNYRSSIAKAIHKKLRLEPIFKTDLFATPWEALTLQDKVELGRLEHIRWNAYMRTEGYCYAPKRCDLAKTHHNLVPVDALTYEDLRKDA